MSNPDRTEAVALLAAGSKAARAGEPSTACPFSAAGSPGERLRAAAWMRGWVTALKADPALAAAARLEALFDVSQMPPKLQAYWLGGEGGTLIGWGTSGDYTRCQAALKGKVPGRMIDGTCANLHKKATGQWPGDKGKAAGRMLTWEYAAVIAAGRGAPVDAESPMVEPPADKALPADADPTEVDDNECTCCAGSGEHDCGHECYVCDAAGTLEAQAETPTVAGLAPGDPILCEGHHGRPDPCNDGRTGSECEHEPEHYDPDSAPEGTPVVGDTPPVAEDDAEVPVEDDAGMTAAGPEADTETQAEVDAETDGDLTWTGVLAPEGVTTGDKRKFREGSITWLNSPVVLKAMFADKPGHDDSVPVGLILGVERKDGKLHAHGTWDTGPNAVEARRQNVAGLLRGVSVDLDATEFSFEDDDGNSIEGDDLFELAMDVEPTLVIESARMRAATLWCTPAFVEAYVLDSTVADEVPDTSVVDAGPGVSPLGIAAAAMYADAPARKSAAPASAFANPGLTEPTSLTVTDDGRVFGHIATWGVCHIGIDGACVTPPNSETDYAYFCTGMYPTSDGEAVPVGAITLGTGHADLSLNWRPTVDHYDHTGTAAAYINVGEDEVGIWFAGVLDEYLPEPQRLALQRSGSISGDWRAIGGGLELVAALGVNVPGFPIPRVKSRVASLAASGGLVRPTSLVASGIVTHAEAGPVRLPSVAELAREVTAYQTRQARLDSTRRKMRKLRQATLAGRLTKG